MYIIVEKHNNLEGHYGAFILKMMEPIYVPFTNQLHYIVDYSSANEHIKKFEFDKAFNFCNMYPIGDELKNKSKREYHIFDLKSLHDVFMKFKGQPEVEVDFDKIYDPQYVGRNEKVAIYYEDGLSIILFDTFENSEEPIIPKDPLLVWICKFLLNCTYDFKLEYEIQRYTSRIDEAKNMMTRIKNQSMKDSAEDMKTDKDARILYSVIQQAKDTN